MVEAATGDFYIADKIEEPKERTRVQKFDSEGKFIAQALIKLSAGGEHEVELRAIALDAEKHKLYVLVDGEPRIDELQTRPQRRGGRRDLLDLHRSAAAKNSKPNQLRRTVEDSNRTPRKPKSR